MLDNTRKDWKSRAANLSFRGQAFINGHFFNAVSRKTFDCTNSATGTALTQVAKCDAPEIDQAVAGGRAAFEDGLRSRIAPGDRKAILRNPADLTHANLEEMALPNSLDMGKLVRNAVTVDAIRWL